MEEYVYLIMQHQAVSNTLEDFHVGERGQDHDADQLLELTKADGNEHRRNKALLGLIPAKPLNKWEAQRPRFPQQPFPKQSLGAIVADPNWNPGANRCKGDPSRILDAPRIPSNPLNGVARRKAKKKNKGPLGPLRNLPPVKIPFPSSTKGFRKYKPPNIQPQRPPASRPQVQPQRPQASAKPLNIQPQRPQASVPPVQPQRPQAIGPPVQPQRPRASGPQAQAIRELPPNALALEIGKTGEKIGNALNLTVFEVNRRAIARQGINEKKLTNITPKNSEKENLGGLVDQLKCHQYTNKSSLSDMHPKSENIIDRQDDDLKSVNGEALTPNPSQPSSKSPGVPPTPTPQYTASMESLCTTMKSFDFSAPPKPISRHNQPAKPIQFPQQNFTRFTRYTRSELLAYGSGIASNQNPEFLRMIIPCLTHGTFVATKTPSSRAMISMIQKMAGAVDDYEDKFIADDYDDDFIADDME
jgi:hypothetical protein